MEELISRQQAIDALVERFKHVPENAIIAKVVIENLPSVQLGTNLAEVGTNLATKRNVKGFPIDADLLMLIAEEKYGFRARDRLYEIIRYMPKYELSPAQPERKTGRWITDDSELGIKCNKCGKSFSDYVNAGTEYMFLEEIPNFCPNCSEDMRGEG